VLVDLARAGRRLEADPDLELHELAMRRRRRRAALDEAVGGFGGRDPVA
jgi:hypothetical protein